MEDARSPRGRRGGQLEDRNLSAGRARTLLAVLAVAAAAAVVSIQLFVHPIVGLADNGDFAKIMAPAGLAYETDVYGERYWNWALVKFAIVPAGRFPGEYRSSETLLAKAAVEASRRLRPGKDFDIRILGVLHLALFAAFVGLIAAATPELPFAFQVLLLAMTVFFFTDVGYVAEFNSLYSQTASLLFLLLTIGIAAVAHPAREGSTACGSSFTSAAPRSSSARSPRSSCTGRCSRSSASSFLGRTAASGGGGPPDGSRWASARSRSSTTSRSARGPIREVGLYHTVFMELLPHSPDPCATSRRSVSIAGSFATRA